jgi:hypothetical protein
MPSVTSFNLLDQSFDPRPPGVFFCPGFLYLPPQNTPPSGVPTSSCSGAYFSVTVFELGFATVAKHWCYGYKVVFVMEQIKVTPTDKHPLPDNTAEEIEPTLQANARVAANTAGLMFELGMPFEMTQEDHDAAAKLFSQMDKKRGKSVSKEDVNPPELYTGNVALKLTALLTEYDHRVVLDATQARTYVMNRLLELSNCGDSKSELRALELIGKMSDVGAFTEKSEVTITHRASSDLREILKEKLSKLLMPEIIDVSPKTLSEELDIDGVNDVEKELAALDSDPVQNSNTLDNASSATLNGHE